MRLARDILVTELDERMETVDNYVKQFNVSRGTVQKAMEFLVEQRCVATYFRGHLGSFLIAKDNEKLWEYSGFGTLSGAMGLPLGSIVAGLATGVCDCMKAENIAFNCVFVQGSQIRVNGLRQGKYDFIVASKLTEQVVSKEYNDVEKVLELTNCAYGARYVLMFADPMKSSVEDGMSVAVDPASIDQMYLTKLVCEGKKGIRFDESTYLDTHYRVRNGQSDLTVSRTDTVMTYEKEFREAHVKELTLQNYSRNEIDSFGTAVVLSKNDNYGMADLLRKILRPNVMAHSQKQVISKLRSPGYY
jgi:invasion protein IalB